MFPKVPSGRSAQSDHDRSDEERISAGEQVRRELVETVHADMIPPWIPS